MSPVLNRLPRLGAAVTLTTVLLVPAAAGAVRIGPKPVSLAQAEVKLTGDVAGAQAGFRVQAVGDLDGDGFDDLAVGAWLDDSSGADAGAVYVVYGPVSANLSLANASAKLTGEGATAFAGETMAGPADIDGDGYDDLIVGAPGPVPGQGDIRPGRTYVVYGGPTRLNGTSRLPDISSAVFLGEMGADNASLGLEADDLDADGVDDLIIAGPGWTGLTGKVWVVYGRAERFAGEVAVAEAAAGSFLGEHPGAATGFSLAGGDDLDGDGFTDLVIGAQSYGAANGAAHVVYGSSGRFTGMRALATTGARIVGAGPGDIAGTSVATGDLDGDGRGDLIIGAPGPPASATDPGKAYVFYGGRRIHLPTTVDAADVVLVGEAAGDRAGFVAVVPDLSGGGRGQLAVGAFRHDPGASGVGLPRTPDVPAPGAVYVTDLTSKGQRLTGRIGLATAKQKYVGEAASDAAGRSPVGTLDANGDGLRDLLIGAEGQDQGGTDAGAAYLVFGQPRPVRPSVG